MTDIENIRSFQQIKTLSDPRRLSILRLLMASPATLTQLGQALGEHPAWIRHHLKLLEEASLVEMVETRISGGFVEKYYRAKARVFFFHQVLLPKGSKKEVMPLLGSHDLALELLTQAWNAVHPEAEFLALPVGSLEGLIALRQGMSTLTGCHLLDAESGEYNRPFVSHLFPDRKMNLITLAMREQGLLLANGNPLQIRSLEDLRREDITLINRNRGSGTRIWLDGALRRLGIASGQIQGYAHEAYSHTEVAQAIQGGRADVGVGLRAAAVQHGLDFIPLFLERYDLVIPEEQLREEPVSSLLDYLHSGSFRRSAEALGGYEMGHAGEQIAI
jgi:putative molybdopterin biosynthesis protein